MTSQAETASRPEEKLKFPHLLPFAFPILVFVGVSRLYFYYATFHINIISFLDFGEIVTSFLDVTIVALFVLSVMFGTLVISSYLMVKGSSWKNNLQNFWIVIASAIIIPYILSQLNASTSSAFAIFFFFFLAAFLFGWIYNMKDNDQRLIHSSKSMLISITYILLGLLFLFFISKSDANSTIKEKKYYGVTVTYKDSTKPFVSDSNNYYIGKTSSYIFLYNQKTNKTKIQKMDNVESIEFPEPRGK